MSKQKGELYRFRPLNEFTLNEIATNQLWFSKLSHLNDPCEGMIKINANTIDPFELADPCVCCFTQKPYSLPMWTHYADNHRGVCLIYELDDSVSGILKVHYFDAPPDLRSRHWYSLGRWFSLVNWLSMARSITAETIPFARKSIDWKYEKEFRMVRFEPVSDPNSKGILQQIKGVPLTAVLFGFKSEAENHSLVNNLAPDSVEFFLASTPSDSYTLSFDAMDRSTLTSS